MLKPEIAVLNRYKHLYIACYHAKSIFIALLLLSILPTMQGGRNITSDSSVLINTEVPEDMTLTEDSQKKSEALSAFTNALIKLKDDDKFTKDSIDLLISTISNDPDALIPLYLLRSTLFSKEFNTHIIEQLYPIAQANPTALHLNRLISEALISTKKYAKAEKLLANSIDNMPKILTSAQRKQYLPLLVALSIAYETQNKFAEGDKLFSEIIKNKNFANNFTLYKRAVLFYNAAEKQASDKSSLWLFSSNKEKFKQKLEYYLNKLPDMAHKTKFRYLGPLLSLYKKKHSLKDAEHLIIDLLLTNPNNPNTLRALGPIFHKQKRYQQVYRILQQLPKPKKSPANYYLTLGQVALQVKRYQDAIKALEWYLISHPDDIKVIYQIAFAYFELGQYHKTIKKIEKAGKAKNSNLTKNLPECLYLAALACKQLHQYPEAIGYFKKAEKIASELKDKSFLSKSFYLTFAFICEQAKEVNLTIDILKKLKKKYPKDPEIKNFLGYVLADHNRELDNAEILLKAALRSKPYSSAYLDSIAWLYYRKKEYELAEKYINKALFIDKHDLDPVICDHAGDIFHAVGNMKKAVYYWNIALQTYSPDLDYTKLEDKLSTYSTFDK
jgi:lipopolysaccharide biosynthesis regulator YciM